MLNRFRQLKEWKRLQDRFKRRLVTCKGKKTAIRIERQNKVTELLNIEMGARMQ